MSAKVSPFLYFALIYAVLIFVVSAIPQTAPPPELKLGDKVLHFIEFSILSFLLFLALFSSGKEFLKKHVFLISSVIGIAYAVSDEIHQKFVPGRSCEFLDLVADSLGIVFVQMVIWLYLKKKRKITAV